MSGPPLRVAFDATPLLGVRTGIGVFVHELLDALVRQPGLDLRAYAVTWRGRGDLGGALPAGVTPTRGPMPARPLREAWKRSGVPPIELWSGRVGVVHGTNFVVPPTRRAARIVTVHDLTAWRFPELVAPASRDFPALVGRAVREGARVHVNSRSVGAEVEADLGVPSDRVRVIRPGVPPVVRGDPAIGRDLAGTDRYVLALGTVEPRKDLPLLVRAFDAVATADPDVRLVVAGPDGWGTPAYEAAVASIGHGDRVVRLGYVGEPERAGLLAGATLFAYPSVYEGFGFPPLEAMSVGTAVVATSAGAVPEVCGDAAALVDVGDTDGLAATLGKLLADAEARAAFVAAGRARVEAFSWATCAQEMSALYAELASSTSR